MSDASRGCIWVMRPDSQGVPDPTTLTDFVVPQESDTDPFAPVDITEGPEGALYVPNFGDNSITRIRYFADGEPPIAKISADHTYGPADPLSVHFSAAGSRDPEEGPLHYAWDLDGDGEFDDGGDEDMAAAEYSVSQNVRVGVRVTDEDDNADEAFVTVYPGDLGPPNRRSWPGRKTGQSANRSTFPPPRSTRTELKKICGLSGT